MSGDSKAGPPEPADIRSAREQAGLTQVDAAALVHATDRAWRYWETGESAMPQALWELFQMKVAQRADGDA